MTIVIGGFGFQLGGEGECGGTFSGPFFNLSSVTVVIAHNYIKIQVSKTDNCHVHKVCNMCNPFLDGDVLRVSASGASSEGDGVCRTTATLGWSCESRVGELILVV